MEVGDHYLRDKIIWIYHLVDCDLHRRLGVGEGTRTDAGGLAAETVGKLELYEIHIGALESAVRGTEGCRDGGGLDNAQGFTGDPSTHPTQVA